MKQQTKKVFSIYRTVASLNEYLLYPEDKELYESFYSTSCQFVYADVKGAIPYFYEVDPYNEYDPNNKVGLTAITIASMVVKQLVLLEGVLPQYQKDVFSMLDSIWNDLLTCFEFLKIDKE